jgi:hypothetical protein
MGVKRAQTGEVGGFGNLFQISQGAPQPYRSLLIGSRLFYRASSRSMSS